MCSPRGAWGIFLWKQWQIFFSPWAPKSPRTVTAAMKLKDACSLEEKAMANLDNILKNSDITFPTKVRIVITMVFSVVMYGCDSWTIKNVECWRIDAFELWCWKRLLRVPWTTRSNQSILKHQSWIFIGSTDAEAEAPILCPPDVKNWLIGKDPDAGKDLRAGGEGDDRGWDGWMASPTQWIWIWVNSGVGDGQGGLANCGSWGYKESDMTEWLNWTKA